MTLIYFVLGMLYVLGWYAMLQMPTAHRLVESLRETWNFQGAAPVIFVFVIVAPLAILAGVLFILEIFQSIILSAHWHLSTFFLKNGRF